MTGSGPCDGARHALAVYVLGAIEPADRAVVDAHLAGCGQCRQELAGLAGLPALLRRVTPAEAADLALEGTGAGSGYLQPGSGQALSTLLVRAVRARRRRLRIQLAAAAAAGVIAGMGSVLGWSAGQGTFAMFSPGSAAGTGSMATARAANPQTLAHATVRYATTPWGVRLQVRVSGIPVGTNCELEVIGSGGQLLRAGGWTIGIEPAMWYPAATWLPLSQVRGFIISSGRSVWVAIPVRDPQPAQVRTSSERTGRTARDHRYAPGTERLR